MQGDRDHQDHSIVKIGKDTEKIRKLRRRVAVALTSVKCRKLTLKLINITHAKTSSPRGCLDGLHSSSGGARFIVWSLRRLFFRGMLTGPEAFLKPLGVFGFGSIFKISWVTLSRLVSLTPNAVHNDKKNCIKGVEDLAKLGGKSYALGIAQRLKFYYNTKWYIQKQESVLNKESHKIFWDAEIQTDHQIPAKRADPVVIRLKKQ